MPPALSVADVMEPAVAAVGPGDTVQHALCLMRDRRVGSVLVLDAGRLVGIFTERDILRRVVNEARDPAATPVRAVMTAPVLTVAPDRLVRECRALFTERRIRHLPVAGPDGALLGMLTSGDVLAFEADEQRTAIEHLESYVYHNR